MHLALALRQGLRRLAYPALALGGAALVFASAKIYDPYLVPLRHRGIDAIFAAELAVAVGFALSGLWSRARIGKLLVVLWCLPPVTLAGAVAEFENHRQAVLLATGEQATSLGRHFMIGYSSLAEIAPLAARGLIGGVYIARHNIARRTAAELKAEITQLQELRRAAGLAPLIIAADQEGGIVSHLSPQLTALPALATLAELPPAPRLRESEAFGRLHGRELADLGVTLNFAPVVDLRHGSGRNLLDFNSLIGQRAISEDPALVAEIALAYAKGLQQEGVGATLKHFPGLGRVRDDTHHFRARLATPTEELERSDWIPFRKVMAQSNAALMIGHVALSAIDPDHAASHSKAVIDGLIRGQWGYQGIVVTDDFVMGAIYLHGVCRAAVQSLNAGVDLVLVAYDGLQFYRMFDCALQAAARGEIDGAMREASAARLAQLGPPPFAPRGD